MAIVRDEKQINDLLTRGVEEIFVHDHLKERLLTTKKPLRVKLGFDPTGPKIHIGRAVILRKLKAFQDLGHTVVFIVGDFTALIGDPSDKLGKRPMLTETEIKANLKAYKKQVGKIINLKRAEFHFNSSWLKKLKFQEIVELAESFSVQQMLARRNFKERWVKQEEISLREFMYPIMQGYDSVQVKADVEIGGFDQLFNLKAGRIIQKHYGFDEQDILTTEMLEGTDGRKMSTSWGNIIAILDEPNDMFGRVMSIHDDLIKKYFRLCTDRSDHEIEELAKKSPRDAKLILATDIVLLYHGETAAKNAHEHFVNTFSKKETPKDIESIQIHVSAGDVVSILKEAGLIESNNEGRRLVEQGGVRIGENLELVADSKQSIEIPKSGLLVKIGKKRFVRIIR